MAIIPPYLKKGDAVAIVASARKINSEELQPAIDLLKSRGLTVVLGKNIFCTDNQFAGTDAERSADMQWALNDENIKAIFVARGGYGTTRIIDNLNFTKFISNPKWVVGYSDITVLHQHIHQNCNVATLHATMPINFTKNKEATESLYNALFGEKIEYTFPSYSLNRIGEASGKLIGGNLSLIYSLCGSKSDINTKGKILFIEDLDEYLYHIDRMMLNLKRSGKLENLAALVVGGMTEMKDNPVSFGKTAEEIIYDAVKEYNYPLCFHFPAGHIDRNMALVMGTQAVLQVHKNETSIRFVL